MLIIPIITKVKQTEEVHLEWGNMQCFPKPDIGSLSDYSLGPFRMASFSREFGATLMLQCITLLRWGEWGGWGSLLRGFAGAWGRDRWKLKRITASLCSESLWAILGLAETPCVCAHGRHFSRACETLLKHTCLWYRAQAGSPARGPPPSIFVFKLV